MKTTLTDGKFERQRIADLEKALRTIARLDYTPGSLTIAIQTATEALNGLPATKPHVAHDPDFPYP